MTIDPKKYQNSDIRQLATDLNEILTGNQGGVEMSPTIVYLPLQISEGAIGNPLVYEIPSGTKSLSIVNTSNTENLTFGYNIIRPGGNFSFSDQTGFFGAQTVTITATGSAEIAHTTPTI